MFIKAITTIRALSSRTNYGLLPRPPAENRVKLYGLYKQATEGNVQGIMPRPEGYTMEDEGAKKKWDAWKQEEGLSKTQAKRNYIQYLIETMKIYANGTPEARELLSELEFLWDQIKDIEFVDEDDTFQSNRLIYPYNVARLVGSFADHSDRFSTGTPWPLQSNYSELVLAQQNRNNIERIYSHSRRSLQLSVNETGNPQRLSGPLSGAARHLGRHLNPTEHSASTSAPSMDDLKAWQNQVNVIISKLSREIATGKYAGSNLRPDSDPEEVPSPRDVLMMKILYLVKRIGIGGFHLLKNLVLSLFTILFVVWCANKSVLVQRTVVRKQLHGISQKELIINMVINTDENKWFIRLLSFINGFVGFV